MASFYHNIGTNSIENSEWITGSARRATEGLVSGGYTARDQLPALPMPNPGDPPEYDVFIAGSGPVGATYAKILVEAGYNVCMADVGDIDSPLRGSHKKNNLVYQKDIDKFVNVIQGALSTVSVAPNQQVVSTLASTVFRPNRFFTQRGINPEQNPFMNLPAQAVTRVVGGMATHWTCAVPRFNAEELPVLDSDAEKNVTEWDKLYSKAEALIKKGDEQFNRSIRHLLVLESLQKNDAYSDRKYQQIPLACERKNPTTVEWSSAHTVFDLENRPNTQNPGQRFNLYPTTMCEKLVLKDGVNSQIEYAVIRDFESDNRYKVKAKVFILATGAVHNPQILVASGLAKFGSNQTGSRIPNLGHYITEQTMSFCQTVFSEEMVNKVTVDLIITGTPGQPDYDVEIKPESECVNPPWWNERVRTHMLNHQEDPIPIPYDDPEPQVTTLFNSKHPWHTQIHRDAFSYGAIAESIDTRLIVDWRFFGRTQPVRTNQLYFSEKYTDAYSMPQPTFYYDIKASSQTAQEADKMMNDMINMASTIGGFLPGSDPQFMAPGLALHLGGTHRSGLTKKDTVVDVNSKVWDFDNLFLGGVGNIPTAYGSNPTLTAMAYAIKSSDYIKTKFTASAAPTV